MSRVSLVLASVFSVFFGGYSHASGGVFETPPTFIGDRIVVEANDAGEVVTLSEAEYFEMTGQKFMSHLVSFFNFKKSWQDIASYITPALEQEFDVFIIINVDYEGRQDMNDEIPAQHMKVVQRTKADQAIFNRKNGRVISIRGDVAGNNGTPAFPDTITALNGTKINGHGVMSDLIPVSSGAGHKARDPQPYVDTPTGIYRINHARSDVKRYGTGMWHSLYFDLIYPWNKPSGLAVHGTSSSKYGLLGKKQDSHGCVRVKKNVANLMYENLINDDYWWTEDLPNLNNRLRLKSETGDTKPGARALIILFYGYERANPSWDI